MSDNWADRATRTYAPPERPNDLQIPDGMAEALRTLAAERQISITELLREAIRVIGLESQSLPAAFMRAEQRVQQLEQQNRLLSAVVGATDDWEGPGWWLRPDDDDDCAGPSMEMQYTRKELALAGFPWTEGT